MAPGDSLSFGIWAIFMVGRAGLRWRIVSPSAASVPANLLSASVAAGPLARWNFRFGWTPSLPGRPLKPAIPPVPAVRPTVASRPIEASKAAIRNGCFTSIAGVPLATTVGAVSAHLRRSRTTAIDPLQTLACRPVAEGRNPITHLQRNATNEQRRAGGPARFSPDRLSQLLGWPRKGSRAPSEAWISLRLVSIATSGS